MKLLKILTLCMMSAASLTAGDIYVIKFKGAINPISANYIEKRIALAEAEQAELVIIQMDTPGGLDISMRQIVQKILDSKVTVVTQVYPKGARAASAGLFVALASDYVAMSEGTNLGAAHPVLIGGGAVGEKITNDAAAYIRSLAEKNGKNAVWAEDAVRKSVSITETEALKQNVSDLISSTTEDLTEKLDGKKVKRLGKELKLKGLRVIEQKMSFWEKTLQVIGDPDIAYILLILGIFGIIFEFTAPGTFAPGVIGGICIILALTAMGSIPISVAGAVFIALAFVLFIMELKITSYGLLGAGGILSLIVGSLMLFNPLAPYFRISLLSVITMVIASSGLFAFLIFLGVASMKNKVVSGSQVLINAAGEVKSALSPSGIVHVNNEDWSAEAKDGEKIKKGEKIVVVEVDGAKLIVKRKS